MALPLLPIALWAGAGGGLTAGIGTVVGEKYKARGKDDKRTREKMSKRDYQRHIFALARNATSPVAELARQRYSGHRWQFGAAEKTLPDEYEQAAIIDGRDGGEQQWLSFDADDREDFRNKQLEKLRRDFRKTLRSHPEFKDRSAKELSEIADAYLSGKDHDAFKTDEVNAALQEVSDYVTGDGEVAMSDERTWRGKYPKKKEKAKEGAKTDDAESAAGTGASTGPRNGTQQAPAGGGAGSSQSQSKADPLRPRGAQPQQTKVAAVSPPQRLGASDTGMREGGAIVEVGDTATRGQIKSAQRDSATADAIEAAEARRDAQTRAKSGDRRRAQQFIADQDALDAAAEARRERKRKEREAKEQTRRNKRFANRTLVNDDDWENLGRPGSDDVDYSDPKNADAKKKRDSRIAELRDQLARLSDRTLVRKDDTTKWEDGKWVREGDTTKWEDGKWVVRDKDGSLVDTSKRKSKGVGDDGLRYVNDFYMYDPDRQRDLAGLRKLVEKGIKDGTITDAQIEGATKTLDSWESAARSRKEKMAELEQRRQAERISGLRKQYGMEDEGLYDDPTVEEYDKQVQKARRKEILRTMATARASGNTLEYGKAWRQLIGTGFDTRGTLDTALGDPAVKKAYDDARMKIDTNTMLSDATKAEWRDHLRHRTIMTQAFKDAGIEGEAGLPNLSYGTQPRQQPVQNDSQNETTLTNEVAKYSGAKVLPPVSLGPVSATPPPIGDSQSGNVPELENEVEKYSGAKVLPPVSMGSNPTVEPIKPKKDDEVGASLGGYAMPLLRPRRRS